jgi:hypothetical protein
MMSSVIPARLMYQCGHAALVTLPRVKGETSAQRNERVAREKSAALVRQCDFCAPVVEVATASNGTHVATMADVVEAEPVVVSEPVAPLEMPAEAPVEVSVETAVEVPTLPSEEAPAAVNGTVQAKPVRRRRARSVQPERVGAVRPERISAVQRFRVEYRVERVLRASDIRDALRRASALSGGEVLSITRDQ